MEMKPVVSSNLESVGYDPETRVLQVKFKGGPGSYRYFDVPQEIHEGLMTATSKGQFLNAKVKGFRYEKVKPETPAVEQKIDTESPK